MNIMQNAYLQLQNFCRPLHEITAFLHFLQHKQHIQFTKGEFLVSIVTSSSCFVFAGTR